jgi:hypothetical protein
MIDNSFNATFIIHGISVNVRTKDQELIRRLNGDFHAFKASVSDSIITIEARLAQTPSDFFPRQTATSQSLTCLCYDVKKVRYVDYHGSASVRYDFENDHAVVIALDIQRLHEKVYLLILSRTGEMMDIKGLHKLHAFALAYQDRCVLVTMPPKGGKTTLMWDLLKNPEFSLISDDTPIIDRFGDVLPFPIRIGLSERPEKWPFIELDRGVFGKKFLVSPSSLPNPLPNRRYQKSILIEARRRNAPEGRLKAMTKIHALRALIAPMVIGVGLPIIVEYFWRSGLWEFLRKTLIALSRLWSAVALSFKTEAYLLELGTDRESNRRLLSEALKR